MYNPQPNYHIPYTSYHLPTKMKPHEKHQPGLFDKPKVNTDSWSEFIMERNRYLSALSRSIRNTKNNDINGTKPASKERAE